MTYKVTFYSQRLPSILRGLRGEWDANRKYHHAQATGLTLAQIAMNRRRLSEFLDIMLDYVVMRGIYGVDGILLSLMSAAQYLDRSRFSRAMGLCDAMSGSINLPPKDGFGIYFFDFGVTLHGQGLNLRAQTLPSSVSGLLSGFPDDARNSMFNGGIENGFSPGVAFGGLVRGIGAQTLEELSTRKDQMALYGLTETQCVGAFQAGGAALGMVGGSLVAGTETAASWGLGGLAAPIIISAGVSIGKETGEVLGNLICGTAVNQSPSPSGGPGSGGASGVSSGSGTGSGSGSGAASGSGSGAGSGSGSGSGSTSSGGENSGSGSGSESGGDSDSNSCGITTGTSTTIFTDPDYISGGPDDLPGANVMRALGISFGPPTNRPLTPRDKLGHPVQVEPLGNGNTFISVPERAGPDVTPDVDSTSGPRTGDSGGSTRGGGGGGIVDPTNPNP